MNKPKRRGKTLSPACFSGPVNTRYVCCFFFLLSLSWGRIKIIPMWTGNIWPSHWFLETPAVPPSWISGDEVESEIGRRWAEAPSTCESAHFGCHGLVARNFSLEKVIIPLDADISRNLCRRRYMLQSVCMCFCTNNIHPSPLSIRVEGQPLWNEKRSPLKIQFLPHFWAASESR